jgi:DNA-binding transcriptional regulator YhcF (GntR family)
MTIELQPGVPLHQQISARLREEITSGALEPHARLPSEQELGSRFDVSRVTVRRALQTLEADGLIYRRQGLGSFVCDRRVPHGLVRLTDFAQDLQRAGLDASSRVLHRGLVECPPEVAERLGVEAGASGASAGPPSPWRRGTARPRPDLAPPLPCAASGGARPRAGDHLRCAGAGVRDPDPLGALPDHRPPRPTPRWQKRSAWPTASRSSSSSGPVARWGSTDGLLPAPLLPDVTGWPTSWSWPGTPGARGSDDGAMPLREFEAVFHRGPEADGREDPVTV